MLRERIHNTRKELATIDKQLIAVHLLASNSMKKEDWDKVDNISHLSMQGRITFNTERQKKKFEKLSPPKTEFDSSQTVVNLTKYQLTKNQISVLAKGGNFAVTPNSVPLEDIISSIEAAITSLPDSVAEEIRTESSRILKKAKSPKCNISYSEKKAIKELNAMNNILILPADKGSATVVMEMEDYKQKIRDILEPNNFKKLQRDPTSRIIRQINNLVKVSSVPQGVQKSICMTEAVPPRLYGLPKIHKTDVPLRPIVSAIGSATYHIAKYLASLLQPHIGKSDTHVKDSTHFLQKIGDLHLEPEDQLISLDVVSLFTRVPIEDSIKYISELFEEDITKLFQACLTTNYFLWDGEFYEQVDGVAMGSPLSPVVANFFMERFENHVLDTAPFKPKVWYRYVDDTFVVWSHGDEELDRFLQYINKQNKNIQFTLEKESQGKLPFLDVLVIRKGHQLEHTVYRKPTHTDRYLNKYSNHHPCQKRGIIKMLTDRARAICLPKYLSEELHHLQTALQKNDYTKQEIKRAAQPSKKKNQEPTESIAASKKAFLQYIPKVTDRIGRLLKKHNIRTIFKPTRKIQNCLRSAKDHRDQKTTGGVYRIPCNCGQVYIGTTKRSINTRIQEHERHCRLGQGGKSAVAEHALLNEDHRIMFEKTQVLDNTTHYHTRLHREAIEIHKHSSSTFNRKEEVMKVRKIWHSVLNKCNKKPFISGNDNSSCNKQSTNQTRMDMPVSGQSEIKLSADQSRSGPASEPTYITRSHARRSAHGGIHRRDLACSARG